MSAWVCIMYVGACACVTMGVCLCMCGEYVLACACVWRCAHVCAVWVRSVVGSGASPRCGALLPVLVGPLALAPSCSAL